jgi:hypothetical protein
MTSLSGFLRSPGTLDHGHAFFGDTRNLHEAGARLLDDVERLQAEVSHDALRGHRADAAD